MLDGYYVSMFGDNPEYYKQVYESFLTVLKPILDETFFEYKIPVIVAQIKGTSTQGTVNIHQDLTVVDESKYRSYVLWIPLEDSTPNNGAISFLEKSHKVFRNYRLHNSKYLFKEPEEFIKDNSIQYPIEAGQALIFDPATLHFSGANTTNHPRISLGVEIVSKDARMQILHAPKIDSDLTNADLYEVPENFWLHYQSFSTERKLPPRFGTKIKTIENVRLKPYSLAEFQSLYSQVQNQ